MVSHVLLRKMLAAADSVFLVSDLRIEEFKKRSEEHTSELQSRLHLVCRLLLEQKKDNPPETPGSKMSRLAWWHQTFPPGPMPIPSRTGPCPRERRAACRYDPTLR